MSSPATTKQLDSVALLLKQSMSPTTQLIQVIKKYFSLRKILFFSVF